MMGEKQMDKDELEELKRHWLNDPCWDVETTEGFEEFRDELRKFREEHERRWRLRLESTIEDKTRQLHCSAATAEYILYLEERITALEDRINNANGG